MNLGRPPVPTIDASTAVDRLDAPTTDGEAPLLVDVRGRPAH